HRLGAPFYVRPPGVDIAAHVAARFLLCLEMKGQRAAAAGLWGSYQLDAEAVEHARRSGVGVGRQTWLHAAVEDEHLARMGCARPCASGNAAGNLPRQRV